MHRQVGSLVAVEIGRGTREVVVAIDQETGKEASYGAEKQSRPRTLLG